jgi:hypothetical protein
MCREFFYDIGLRDMLDIVKTDEEKAYVMAYKERDGKISKGDTYIRQGNVCEGTAYTFIADKAIFKIFIKYDLFPED